MMRYAYTHIATEATTGYFACEPEPALSLAEALTYLARRPLDEFMRRHCIRRMLAMSAAECRAALEKASGREPPSALISLARELALLDPSLRDALDRLASQPLDEEPSTALVYLKAALLPDGDAQRQWGRVFTANIQAHRALQTPESLGLAPLYEEDCRTPPGLPLPPGLTPAFLREFGPELALVHAEHRQRLPENLTPHARPPAEETAALAEERLSALDIIAGREMRHTASLSPVSLLRPWTMRLSVRNGRHDFSLEGQATTYGRGLSLPNARASCLMEMVERASVYLSVDGDRVLDRPGDRRLVYSPYSRMPQERGPAVDPNDFPLEAPYLDEPLHWMAGHDAAGGLIYVPAQLAGLFSNLDEIALMDAHGSTGIAAGNSMEEAKIAALLEIIERDAEATTPFGKSSCFTLEADDDPALGPLLREYKARGVNVQFQDLAGPLGVPVFQCFVMSPKGAVARGCGAGLSASRALLSALTETPYPYLDAGPSGPLLRKLPSRSYKDLPDFSLPTPRTNLALLEDILIRSGRPPVYVDLTRAGLDFPVVRALVPGLELTADRDAFSRVPFRLYARYCRISRHDN